jgi:predicted phage gp36 major capsid-like protein
MRPFETADVAFLETLRTRHEALKAKLAAAKRAQDAEHAAKIAAELREMIDKASAELFRLADRLANADGSSGRAAPVVVWLA